MEATFPAPRRFSASLAISVSTHVLILALFLLTRPKVIEVGLPGATVVDLMGGALPEAPAPQPAKAEEAPPQPLPRDEIAAPTQRPKPEKKIPPTPSPSRIPSQALKPPTAPATSASPGPGTSATGTPNPAEARIGLSGAPGVASDFPFGYYLVAVRNKVNQNWVQPGVDRHLKTTLFFRIARDGSVRDARVEVSSGAPMFDAAALRAIRISSPFPLLPSAFPRDELGVHFDFEVTH